MRILLADGTTVPAGDIKVGMYVRTWHEDTLEEGDYKVVFVDRTVQPRVEFKFDDVDFICSASHKFFKDGDWVSADKVKVGDKLSNKVVRSIKSLPDGEVVKITVEDAHTYIVEGLFSHNVKSVGDWLSRNGYKVCPNGTVVPITGSCYSVGVEPLAAGGAIKDLNRYMKKHKKTKKYQTGGIANLTRSPAMGAAVNPADGYNFGFAQGGLPAMPEYKAGGKLLRGAGDGMSDSIPAVIRGKGVQRAALAGVCNPG
jgi:hypothetical protein